MHEPAFVPPKWRKPSPLAYGSAMDTVGTVAAPLLAGFSLASVVIVSEDAASFRWPGAALLALTLAAVLLIGTVQCAFNARQYLWSAADMAAWWPDAVAGTERERLLREQQDKAYRRWRTWTKWTRRSYAAGILALLAAVGLALPPLHSGGAQGSLRWVASGLALAAFVGESCWIVVSSAKGPRRGHGQAGTPGRLSAASSGPEEPSCPVCEMTDTHEPGCPQEGMPISHAPGESMLAALLRQKMSRRSRGLRR